jgi:LacI family transcriptional regulator
VHLNEELMEHLLRIDAPVVLVDAYDDDNLFDAVVTDNVAGAYRATEHLIQRGHRHIGIVGSLPDAYPSVRERREGYLQTIRDYGLEPYFADCVLHPSVVEPYVIDLLTAHPQVTALFGCNDDVAIASMRVAQGLGRHIPDDLSVVGFDNIDLSQMVLPGLTTMRVDMLGMGRLAAGLLQNRIEHPEAGRVRTIICPGLVERASVAQTG